MIDTIKFYFPANRGKWLKYTLTTLPVIFSAVIFALNSFVDNFMAVNIKGGNQALSYANSWTLLVTGIVASTTIIGSSLFGQYLGKKENQKIIQVLRARMLFAVFISVIFALPSLINPEGMIKLISGFDNNLNPNILKRAALYTRWISISWILSAWGYTLATILREAGYGTASLMSSIISLVTNILFNSIFIFVMDKDIEFLAYSTIISLVVSLLYMIVYVYNKNKLLIVNPLKIFLISKIIWKQFWKRSTSFILLSISSIAISIRFIFWNYGYPTGSIGDPIYELSAANILGISGMFFNIFWTSFEAINANISIFVGRELGNNNISQAKINSKELQGFHLIIASIMGLSLFILSFGVENMIFLTEGYKKSLSESLIDKNFNPEQINTIVAMGQKEFLKMLKWTLWPLSWNMPIWIWYLTKNKTIASGGLTNVTSLVDLIFSFVQICWIILINYVIIKNWAIEFPWAYAIFFLSDILKIPVFETLYYKLKWARNLTNEGKKAEETK